MLLRELIKKNEILVAPGVIDCAMSKIVESQGFRAAYITGYGVTYSKLGYPDVGLVTLTEIIETVKNIANSVDIPIICDADTGYGNYLNVFRTVREFERAGASAIHLEDQQTPKKCFAEGENTLISIEEMIMKIKSACEARTDPDFVIIARTDANIYEGFESALKRCEEYSKTEADVIFLENVSSKLQLEKIPKVIRNKPLLACTVQSKDSEMITSKDLEEMGYSVQIIPLSFVFSAYYAFENALKEFNTYGHTKFISDKMYDIPSFNNIMGLEKINKLIEKYNTTSYIPCINCKECLGDSQDYQSRNNITENKEDLNQNKISIITEEVLKRLNKVENE